MPETSPRIILASASPRRRELLALLGLPFTVEPSRYEEPGAPKEPVVLTDFVRTLAMHKAEEVARRSAGVWVVGADTEVALEEGDVGLPLGKPTDAQDAARMLRNLSGRAHSVYTGVAVIEARDGGEIGEPFCAAVRTRVRFREMSDAMITDYVATGEPLDKAGAYGAQGYAAPFIEGFDGDFFNVVGLPLCELGRLFERAGVLWWHYRQQMPPVIG
jgi:septum formation protein